MPTQVQTADFLSNLEKSGVVPRERLHAIVVRDGLRDNDDPIDVARALVREHLLTQFQAERILQGRWRGLVIDHYQILDVLGAGGMGWVYIARDTESGWKVALKVLAQSDRTNAGMLARLQLEAEAGIRLQHPNILRTLASRKSEDNYGTFHYVVMELVQGVTPLELLALTKQLSVAQACDIIRQAASGLAYAHNKGLIHRDVKPENLLIRTNGAVKILDFGLAMIDEDDEEFAMAMIFGQDRLGTADYVAPEQTINSYTVDHRADIYSLGCTFYFLLTGRVPFEGRNTAAKIECHRKHRPRPVKELRPEVPDRVDLIVRKMMAKRPENRIQKAEDVARLLEPLAEQTAIEFDFPRVLRARLKQARQRQTLQKLRRRKTDSVADAASRALQTDAASRALEAELDTRIRHDTKVQQGLQAERPVEDFREQ